jgi:hypothetical protein
MSLRRVQGDFPSRSRRDASRPQAERRLPETVRGRNSQKLSPRRELRGRDADVVAAVVLDEEVTVAGLGEGDAAQPLLGAVALVAELVGGVDADPADHAHGQRQAEVFDDAEAAVPPLPAGEDQPGVLDRDEEVGAPAVVVVLLQPLEDRVGRVGGVQPDRQVEQRERTEDEDGTEEPEAAEAGRFDRAPGDERGQRDEDAEQPGVALAVAPGSRIDRDVVVVVMVMRVFCMRLHALSSLSNVRLKSACLTKIPSLSSTVTEYAEVTASAVEC